VDEAFADESTMQQAKIASAKDVEAAFAYKAKAEAAFEDDELEDSVHFSILADLKLRTARQRLAERRAKKRVVEAKRAHTEAQKRIADAEDLQAKLKLRISRIEKILALQADLESEKAKGRAAKKKLAKELEDAKAESEAAIARERVEREIRELVATVRAKLETARALGAEGAAPRKLKGASDALALAERSALDGAFDDSRKLIARANEAAEAALAAARKANAAKGARLKSLEQQESLLAAAAALVPTSAKQQRGVVVTLYDMFAPGEADILPDKVGLLHGLVNVAKEYSDYPILIEGYTDSRGRDQTNLDLSTERAISVRNEMIRMGLGAERTRAMGYGETRPVADNSTPEGRAKNRRVEVVFLF
jgi:outer membrane protein OmpA-like peptidoglycan-associated protein